MDKKANSGKIGRRDFICSSAAVCCLANMSFPAGTLFTDEKPKVKKSAVNPGELVAYCGLYCGACDIYQKRISKAGNELKKVLDAYNFKSIAKQVPGMGNYEAFEGVLNILIGFFGQCQSCNKGGGNPTCEIRICCKEKGYKTCAECPSVPCEKVKKMKTSEYLQEIKKSGLEKWARNQQAKVDKGFRYSEFILSQKSNAETK